MPNYEKKIRLVSLVEDNIESLTNKVNAVLELVADSPVTIGATTGQTYRTYESRQAGAKKFFNAPFFTNSITIAFVQPATTDEINEFMEKVEAIINEEEASSED